MWSANEETPADDQCEDLLRQMEIESYSKIVSVFRAKGTLTDDRRKLLKQISSFLNIPGERQRAEARKVSTNTTLSKIAHKLTGEDGTVDWYEEGRRNVPVPDRLPLETPFTPLADYIAGIATFGSSFIEEANRACALIKENPAYEAVASSSKSITFDEKVIEGAKGILKAGNLRDVSIQTLKRKAPPPRGCTYCKRRKELRKKKLATLQKEKAEEEEEVKESLEDNSLDVEEKGKKKNRKEEYVIELPSGRKIIVENTVTEDGKEEIHDMSATIIAQEVEIETEPPAESKPSWDDKQNEEATTSSKSKKEQSNEPDITDPSSQSARSDSDQGNVRAPRILSTGKSVSNDRKKRKKSEDKELDNSIWSGDWAVRSGSNSQKQVQKKSLTEPKPKKAPPQKDNIILQSDVESQLGYTKKRPELCISGHDYAQKSSEDNSNPYRREYRTSVKFVHRRNAKSLAHTSPEPKSKTTSQSTKLLKGHITKSPPDDEFEGNRSDEFQEDDLSSSMLGNQKETITTSTHFSNRKQSFDRVNQRKVDSSYPPNMMYTPHTYSRKSIKRYETVVKPQTVVSPNFKPTFGPELLAGVSYSISGESSKLEMRTSNLTEYKKYDISVSDKNVISLQSPLGHLHKMSSNSMPSNQLLTLDEGLLIKGRHTEHIQSSRSKIYNGGKKDLGPPHQDVAEILVETSGTSPLSKFTGSQVILNENLRGTEEVTVINGHEDYIVIGGGDEEYLTTEAGHFVIPVRSEEGSLAEVSADGELQFDPDDGRFDSPFHAISVQLPGKNDPKASTILINGSEAEHVE